MFSKSGNVFVLLVVGISRLKYLWAMLNSVVAMIEVFIAPRRAHRLSSASSARSVLTVGESRRKLFVILEIVIRNLIWIY